VAGLARRGTRGPAPA